MIDTHAHLYSEQFDLDRDEMILRAINAGVDRFYLPNIDLESIEGMHQLEKKYPENCFAMMGLHPCSVDASYKSVLDKMYAFLSTRNYCAIGEIGIDLHWDKTFIKEQEDAFRIQIKWAKELQLPIVIHARKSFNELFQLLDKENDANLKGVFHCFSGNEFEVKKINAYGGFYFGLGGVLTYKNTNLTEVIKAIPIEKIVLETDAPYLSPVPFRGKRNESSYLSHTAEAVAKSLGISLAEVDQITTKNAKSLFHPNEETFL